MRGIVDLHTHTTASDGSMSPQELVRHAKESGLAAVAITDHDTVDGVAEALDEGVRIGIEVIPGVEIGVEYKPEMHILGYFTGETYINIRDTLAALKKNREQRNPKIISKLNEMGFNITMEEVKAQAGGSLVGRPHIAKVLMRKGYVGSIEEAFDKLLASGKPAYFKKDNLTPEQGIQAIIRAGGIPVLAHPMYLFLSFEELDKLVFELAALGLEGIEAYYVDNSEEDMEQHLKLARKHKLLVTGGSDFHGSFKPEIKIGKGKGNLNIPYEAVENLKAKTPLNRWGGGGL